MKTLSYHTFPVFTPFPEVVARSYERGGGHSHPPYDSLNGSFFVGDEKESVLQNWEKVRLDTGLSEIYSPNLEHGCRSVEITKSLRKKTIVSDAIFTFEDNLALAMTHADCQVALLYDPSSQMLGIIHAGWRGLMQEIYLRALETFAKRGAVVAKMRIGISPSIGPNHAEYKEYQTIFPKKYWDYHIGENRFDFWRLAHDQLVKGGVLEKHISLQRVCTVSSKAHFSYRRDKVTGRCITIIGKTCP